jgi:plastocyanin
MTGKVTVLATDPQLHMVNAAGISFTPQHITITQGDTVRWENTSGVHNVNETGSTLFFSGVPASAPWIYEFVFNNVATGIYNYQCDLHFGLGMTGTVTVEADQCPLIIVLDPPQELVIVMNGNDAELSWSAVAGATSYQVFNSTNAAVTPFTNIVGTTAATSFTHANAAASEPLQFYQVRALAE